MGGPAWSKDWIGFYNELLSAFFNGIGQMRTFQLNGIAAGAEIIAAG